MMSLPNVLSFIRGLCGPLIVVAVFFDAWAAGFVLFVYAVVSDLLDGPIARRYSLVSQFGGRLDHTADAVFTFCGMAVLAWEAFLPWALPLVQLVAFVEYAYVGGNLRTSLRMSQLGRTNGILYFVIIGIPFTQQTFEIAWVNPQVLAIFAWILFASTVLSIFLRSYMRLQK